VITPGWVTRPIALREAIVAEFGLGMRVAMAPAAAVQAQAWLTGGQPEGVAVTPGAADPA